jgi:hypothetical protein
MEVPLGAFAGVYGDKGPAKDETQPRRVSALEGGV